MAGPKAVNIASLPLSSTVAYQLKSPSSLFSCKLLKGKITKKKDNKEVRDLGKERCI